MNYNIFYVNIGDLYYIGGSYIIYLNFYKYLVLMLKKIENTILQSFYPW